MNNFLVKGHTSSFPYRYVVLEDAIPYDWDDYDVWGAVLFDRYTNEIVTSKYGHGSDLSERPASISLSDALSTNLVTEKKLLDVIVKQLNITLPNIETFAANHSFDDPISIPVNVVRGRKFRGEGYLVFAKKVPVVYGLGAYKNEYNYHPVIFDPKTKTFNEINSFGYIEYSEEFLKNINVRATIQDTVDEVRSLAHAWAYAMSYSSCDSTNYRELINKYALRGLKNMVVEKCVWEGIEILNENKRIAREEKMNKELPSLIEWVRSKGYKNTEEEIIVEAKRIWNKNN